MGFPIKAVYDDVGSESDHGYAKAGEHAGKHGPI